MLPYFVFLGVVFVEALVMGQIDLPVCNRYFAKENPAKWRNGFIWLVCAELIVFTGLRGYTVGADTGNYLMYLEWFRAFTAQDVVSFVKSAGSMEYGYYFLTQFLGWLKFSPTAFLLFISLLIYYPIFCYIRKKSCNPVISVLVYIAFGFFSYSLGIFRQMIAISILILGFKYIYRREFIMWLVFVACAALFHTTAVLAVVLYPLAQFDIRRFVPILVLFELLLVIFGRQVVEFMVVLVPRYSVYVGGIYDLQGGSYLNLILSNVIFFAYLFPLKDKKKLSPEQRLIFAQLAVAILCQCCGYHMAIFGRIVCYYSICFLVVLPELLHGYTELLQKYLPQKWPVKEILWFGSVAALLLLTFREFHGNQYVTPFYFFWQQV